MDAPILPILFRPAAALIGWTFFMQGWMYKVRLPALNAPGVKIGPESTVESMNAQVPAHVRWKGDNYNHLHEAPVRFYAICIMLGIIQVANTPSSSIATLSSSQPDMTLEANLAWLYVAVRIVHSLFQALSNKIMTRFKIFVVSEAIMLGLFARTAMILFGNSA